MYFAPYDTLFLVFLSFGKTKQKKEEEDEKERKIVLLLYFVFKITLLSHQRNEIHG